MIIGERVQLFVCIILCFIQAILAAKSETDYYRYLQQFGYTPKIEGRRLFSVLAKSSYREGILKLQRLYKLPETGELDQRTKAFMQRARCGNPDLGTYESIGRPLNVDKPDHTSTNDRQKSAARKVSDTPIYFWPKNHLKWFIETYPIKQKHIKTHEHIRRIINQAFDDWEKHSGLTFQMVDRKEQADLKIQFRSEDHDDGYPFDGQGATLAHAFYPRSGDIHFDDDEYFTDNYTNGYEEYTLRLVAAHEIGHALGLSHSTKEGALMYPIYQQFNASYQLTEDDREDVQALYGKPEIKPTSPQLKTTLVPTLTSTSATHSVPNDNWCAGEFQTGCEGPDGELYLFNENQVWRYQARKTRTWDPHPKLISEYFPSLIDTTITACVRSSMGYTYLFRNYRMWKMKTHWAVDGPHILHGKHYPQNPRVALLHRNYVYLIRNRLIYRLNELDYDGELEIGTIDTILNPPPHESIQSGFTYDQRHYIFTKQSVYVYDSTHGSLLPGYPKPISNGWFACESASNTRKKSTRTTTLGTATTESSLNDEHDDDHYFHHHHHHHHHHHRPRRPFPFHHRRPPPPYGYRGPPPFGHRAGPPYNYPHPPPSPHGYRRRWED